MNGKGLLLGIRRARSTQAGECAGNTLVSPLGNSRKLSNSAVLLKILEEVMQGRNTLNIIAVIIFLDNIKRIKVGFPN